MSSEDAQSVSSRILSVDPLPIAQLLTGETLHLKQEGPYRDGIAHPSGFSTLLLGFAIIDSDKYPDARQVCVIRPRRRSPAEEQPL